MRKWSRSEKESGNESAFDNVDEPATASSMKNRSILESFIHAFEGLSHVMWTQRHVRVQLFMVMMVLLLCFTMKLSMIEVLLVLSGTAFVIMAELFNTAIEVVVNMITSTYHPLAKIAKDVAAAGVLVASIYATAVGLGVFLSPSMMAKYKTTMVHFEGMDSGTLLVMIFVGLATLFILVPLAKIKVGHGTLLRGGAVSGHSAVAFFFAAAIAVSSNYNYIITSLSFVLAILVAQSRVEGRIHTLREVLWGAAVALTLIALLLAANGLRLHTAP
jgi:diacylglycerol kinase (ATP)